MPDYRDQPTHALEEAPDGALRAYSPDFVASLFDVSRRTIYTLIASGELPSLEIGRLRRIPHSAVVAYLQRQLAATAAAERK